MATKGIDFAQFSGLAQSTPYGAAATAIGGALASGTSSGIDGDTSFGPVTTGGVNIGAGGISKQGLYVLAGVAVLALLLLMRK